MRGNIGHLIIGLTLGIVTFIMASISGALNGVWLEGIQAGLMIGGTTMLLGLILYGVTYVFAVQGVDE